KSPVRVAILDDDAFPVHISDFPQRLLKSSYTSLDVFGRGSRQKTDPRNLRRRLRLDGERRSRNGKGCHSDEGPACHHAAAGFFCRNTVAIFRQLSMLRNLVCRFGTRLRSRTSTAFSSAPEPGAFTGRRNSLTRRRERESLAQRNNGTQRTDRNV